MTDHSAHRPITPEATRRHAAAQESTDQPKRLHNIEALRGVAALSVAWFHLTNTYPHDVVNASGRYGWLGVDVFFVISGFVIPYSMHIARYQVGDFWRFLARRMLRLEPAYLASVILVLVLGLLSTLAPTFQGRPFHLDGRQIGAHLFYLIPLTPFDWVQPVYWSLAYEFVFYGLCGLLYSALWPRHIALTLGLAGGIAACSMRSPGIGISIRCCSSSASPPSATSRVATGGRSSS